MPLKNLLKSPLGNTLVFNFHFLHRFKNEILIEVIDFLYDSQYIPFILGKLMFSWPFLYVCMFSFFRGQLFYVKVHEKYQ